jgi:SH3-like domain-containing protein
VDGQNLGTLARVNSDGVRLRRSPSHAGAVIGELSTGTQLRVIGATGEWQRVMLPDGTSGFVAAGMVDSSYAGTR